MSVWTGHIQFELSLSSAARTTEATEPLHRAQKRPRRLQDEGTEESHERTTTSTDDDHELATLPYGGYVFIRKKKCKMEAAAMKNFRIEKTDAVEFDDCSSHKYLLSVPYQLQNVVADACRYNCQVQLTKFSNVKLQSNGKKTMIKALLEVEELTVLGTMPSPSAMEFDKALTLSEVFQMEAENRQDKQKVLGDEHDSPNKLTAAKLFSVRGIICARSPIVSVQQEPFILVEMVDDLQSLRSIVVIRREALSAVEYGITVNDEIMLVQVQRQKWRVPQTFQQTTHPPLDPIPSHVFVVDHAQQIQWKNNQKRIYTNTISLNNDSSDSLGRPVQGVVERLHWIHMDDKISQPTRRIHWIEMKCMDNEDGDNGSNKRSHQRKCRRSIAWFVTYFPMSSALQLSLRPGARILGFHLHQMASDSYCACLHSQILLLEHPRLETPSTTSSLILDFPSNPYEITSKIRKSYPELVCRLRVTELLSEIRNSTKHSSLLELPSFDVAVATILSGIIFNKSFLLSKKRNVYAEFLARHENDENELNGHENCYDEICDNAAGCCVSKSEQRGGVSMCFPHLVSLTDIQDHAFQTIKQRIQKITNDESEKPIPIGWTGSIRIYENDIAPNASGLRDNQKNVYTLGYNQNGDWESNNSIMVSTALSNGRVEIPVLVDMASTIDSKNKDEDTRNSVKMMNVSSKTNGTLQISSECKMKSCKTFCWARIRSVAVSCICFRGKANFSTSGKPRKRSILKLPKFSRIDAPIGERSACTGPCAMVVTANGYGFFVAVFLVCDNILPLHPLLSPLNRAIQTKTLYSVAACLGSKVDPKNSNDVTFADAESSHSASAFIGLLTRSSFKPYRVKNGVYKDFYFTIAQAPFSSLNPILFPDELDSAQKISCVQSIELKAPIAIERSMYNSLRCLMASFMGDGQSVTQNNNDVNEDQLGLCLAWWELASCSRTCALLGGGWDEASDVNGIKTATAQGTIIQIATSVLQRDPKHGYVRIRCTSDDIVASVISFFSHDLLKQSEHCDDLVFDFSGGQKFLDGFLDQRPSRRQYGEMLLDPVASGVPTYSIRDLYAKFCEALKSGSTKNLSPSLVVEIPSAEFLGVSYCRAIAECSKCYTTLVDPCSQLKNVQHKYGSTTNVINHHCPQRSFWHLPLPSNSADNNIQHVPVLSRDKIKMQSHWTPSLVCPNNCSVEKFGTIKWECSGFLDDGTAKARLYAERQAALCLLGLPPATVKCIEKAAWSNDKGIVFSRTMMPESKMRKAILLARTLAQNRLQRERSRTELNDDDVLPFLTTEIKAEYLMQTHCRFGSAPLRHLKYLVRVKPLLQETPMLHHTSLEINRRNIASYTLPTIGLKLVDCATTSFYQD